MSKLQPAVSDYDHISGNTISQNILVEFGDYQCPHCGHAYPLLKKLMKEKGKDFQFVFRNFPLQESHPAAMKAAYAAEAAAMQNKYWEMHDMIYENQQKLFDDDFHLFFAKKLKLDIEKFIADMDSDDVAEKVAEDFESGIRSGVNGTPTIFFNDAIVAYDTTYQSLLDAVEGK